MSYRFTIKPNLEVLDLEALYLSKENKEKINQLLEEFIYLEALSKYNLPVDNKILLHGATGCGKTATAHALGKYLNKEVVSLNLGTFVSSKLGQTARNITEIFKQAYIDDAILFIDEFDFIAKSRDYDSKDNGEMKRVVNALLQQIDNLKGNMILIAATNYIEIIDSAVKRRFQVTLQYEFPSDDQLDKYYESLVIQYPSEIAKFERKYAISFAEAKDYVFQSVKKNIILQEKLKRKS